MTPGSTGRARDPTDRVYGLHAALAVFARRPDDIVRIVYTREQRHPLAPMLRHAAARHVPYKEVLDDELARVADAVHHEGVCLGVLPRRWLDARELARHLRASGSAALALDGVANPHNVGAVMRSAAYLGTDALLLTAAPTPAAVRVAEGGAEWVTVARAESLPKGLAELRAAGIAVVGTDPHAKASAWTVRWPRPCVVVLGNERTGVSKDIRAQCDHWVAIPGSGRIDSLNVSVTAGVLLSELARTRPHGERGQPPTTARSRAAGR